MAARWGPRSRKNFASGRDTTGGASGRYTTGGVSRPRTTRSHDLEASPSTGFSGRAAHVGAAFSVGIASDASAMHDVKYALDAPPSTGLSGRAAHVGAAFRSASQATPRPCTT